MQVLIDESEVRGEENQEAPELADRVGEKHMLAQRGKVMFAHSHMLATFYTLLTSGNVCSYDMAI